ncbi:MAG: hypothetical protein K8W52_11010 [Deltaproteobacteria bacterium]|nr:hypothetical protein [Deltaproteobacteria bacterium]
MLARRLVGRGARARVDAHRRQLDAERARQEIGDLDRRRRRLVERHRRGRGGGVGDILVVAQAQARELDRRGRGALVVRRRLVIVVVGPLLGGGADRGAARRAGRRDQIGERQVQDRRRRAVALGRGRERDELAVGVDREIGRVDRRRALGLDPAVAEIDGDQGLLVGGDQREAAVLGDRPAPRRRDRDLVDQTAGRVHHDEERVVIAIDEQRDRAPGEQAGRAPHRARLGPRHARDLAAPDVDDAQIVAGDQHAPAGQRKHRAGDVEIVDGDLVEGAAHQRHARAGHQRGRGGVTGAGRERGRARADLDHWLDRPRAVERVAGDAAGGQHPQHRAYAREVVDLGLVVQRVARRGAERVDEIDAASAAQRHEPTGPGDRDQAPGKTTCHRGTIAPRWRPRNPCDDVPPCDRVRRSSSSSWSRSRCRPRSCSGCSP